ncbi:hypothetical protein E2562_013189 [Oryza meyeriana var. granulata]|uniref:Uncharacterized protein n=1 Tax=Oryza meyeriana var. granulata TaxID=110450 RepID=A0A6G1DII2_9ORYZ|nr:hypothetical protein E2562_013189 [Oryza meyeriana var. granulata]
MAIGLHWRHREGLAPMADGNVEHLRRREGLAPMSMRLASADDDVDGQHRCWCTWSACTPPKQGLRGCHRIKDSEDAVDAHETYQSLPFTDILVISVPQIDVGLIPKRNQWTMTSIIEKFRGRANCKESYRSSFVPWPTGLKGEELAGRPMALEARFVDGGELIVLVFLALQQTEGNSEIKHVN